MYEALRAFTLIRQWLTKYTWEIMFRLTKMVWLIITADDKREANNILSS